MNKGNKALNAAEKVIVILGMVVLFISLLLGYWEYALGVALAAPIAWLLYRWQMMAVVNIEGLSPQKATIKLVTRSAIRLFIFLSMIGLSSLGGKVFFFWGIDRPSPASHGLYWTSFLYNYRKGGIA